MSQLTVIIQPPVYPTNNKINTHGDNMWYDMNRGDKLVTNSRECITSPQYGRKQEKSTA